jgi:phosphoribosylaminoimidazolecarboxamide formyltransferase/IMP cyclohydrolase
VSEVTIERALLSVSDKSGLVALGEALAALGKEPFDGGI